MLDSTHPSQRAPIPVDAHVAPWKCLATVFPRSLLEPTDGTRPGRVRIDGEVVAAGGSNLCQRLSTNQVLDREQLLRIDPHPGHA